MKEMLLEEMGTGKNEKASGRRVGLGGMFPVQAGLCLSIFMLLAGIMQGQFLPPEGLSVEMLTAPGKTVIRDSFPEFGWVLRSPEAEARQSACRVQVVELTANSSGKDFSVRWDSGKIASRDSIDFEYQGEELSPGTLYAWRVRVWDDKGQSSDWSEFQEFTTAEMIGVYEVSTYPLETRLVNAVRFKRDGGRHFFDFGKAAFGTVRITIPPREEKSILKVHFAEKLSGEDVLDSCPPGSVRYRETRLEVGRGVRMVEVAIPPDPRNTGPGAVLMPDSIGEVLPFRYCEVITSGMALEKDSVVMKAVNYPFDDQAADFFSSDMRLNDVWALCKYSIKATSFAGLYIDGDRERIAYEADAYINQLGHYLTDREYSMARATHEYLIKNPTWPTEWILHSVLMAWEDYMYTGNLESVEFYFDDLRNKTLYSLEAENGLISTTGGRVGEEILESIHLAGEMRDIVDWPPGSFTQGGTGERDGHVMADFNTVVNAFYYRALDLYSRLAEALGRKDQAIEFADRAAAVKNSFNALLLDREKGFYRDGIGTDHSSLHSNMFPLAFGLVPEEFRMSVVEFVKSRGMACSVYGAQYLLDSLFAAGEDRAAIDMMTAGHDRGWLNMLKSGSTITLEAWDHKYKNNLDWNHAWGAAPANLIPRWILGVRPLAPGFREVVISPRPGDLEWARGKVPTIRGPVLVEFSRKEGAFELEVKIPANMTARIEVPGTGRLLLDGSPVSASREDGRQILRTLSGRYKIRVETGEN